MDRISVLISGTDSLYNEMLALALTREGMNISVSCVSPEMLINDRENRLAGFDIILAEKLPAGLDTEKNNVVLLSERAEKSGRVKDNITMIYKYQSVKSIVSGILAALGRYGDGRPDLSEGALLSESGSGIRLIGVSGASYGGDCDLFGRILAGCLSVSCGTTVLLDMREGRSESVSIYEKREGSRSWDDFIYCCTYGRTGDIFEKPEIYASVDESGFLYFSNRGNSSNPFGTLNPDEIRQFYSNLRFKLNSEFVVNLLPEKGSPGFRDSAGYQDVIILANEADYSEERCSRSANGSLEAAGTFKGRTLNVCLGEKKKPIRENDFYVSLSEIAPESDFEGLVCSQTWADVMKVAGYINEYRGRQKQDAGLR